MINSINEIIKIESIEENHSTISKEEVVKVVESREVVNLTINQYGNSDSYTKSESDILLNGKLDVPTIEDWDQLNLILSN